MIEASGTSGSEGAHFVEKAAPRELRFQFWGRVGEYFRIWIVNVALTLLTLGIYNAWAMVRTRRYVYVNTYLDDHGFEYLARPTAILLGNLIVFGLFAASNIAQNFLPQLAAGAAVAFYAVLPWLVWKTFRFRAHNSAYRGIRFRFTGTLKEAYKVYLLLPIGIALTLGLLYPYWALRRREYFLNNLHYGRTPFRYEGSVKFFYLLYLKALFIYLVPFLAAIGGVFFLVSLMRSPDPAGNGTLMMYLTGGIMLLVMLASYLVALQYLYVQVWNHSWQNTRLGNVSFRSELGVWAYAGVVVTNVLAVIVSLGLLTPWARIRRLQTLVPSLTARAPGDLDGFFALATREEAALGDAAMEFFDFELGF